MNTSEKIKLEQLLTLLTKANILANELGLNCQNELSDIQDTLAAQLQETA